MDAPAPPAPPGPPPVGAQRLSLTAVAAAAWTNSQRPANGVANGAGNAAANGAGPSPGEAAPVVLGLPADDPLAAGRCAEVRYEALDLGRLEAEAVEDFQERDTDDAARDDASDAFGGDGDDDADAYYLEEAEEAARVRILHDDDYDEDSEEEEDVEEEDGSEEDDHGDDHEHSRGASVVRGDSDSENVDGSSAGRFAEGEGEGRDGATAEPPQKRPRRHARRTPAAPSNTPAVPSALLSSLFGTRVMGTEIAVEASAPKPRAGRAGRAGWAGRVGRAGGTCDAGGTESRTGSPAGNGEYEDDEDDDDLASAAPTQCSADFRRQAQQQQRAHRADEAVFAVPGIQCVGCLIGKTRLAEVTAFVHANMLRAPTTKGSALWRLAADVYNTKVKIPCEREGLVDVPNFEHEQIWHHYRYHELIPQLTTVDKCRELRGIREMLTQRIVRYNPDTKEREIDAKTCDQYMKICALERTEHETLQRLEAGGVVSGRARGKAAASAANPQA